jgi:hypothetical protein
MTRKDYVALAAALASARPSDGHWDTDPASPGALAWEKCCRAIGDACQSDNPAFDRTRFVKACLAGS